jgi:TRAP-type C4-dicarboxylate transport system permease large subunit
VRRLVAVAGRHGGWRRRDAHRDVIFAARSGSPPVTLIAIGGIMFPAMAERGLPRPFSLGL